MRDGWLKLHYSTIDWEYADMPNMMAMWIHLLLHAETKTTKRKGITVKRGQILTTLPQLSEWSGLTIQAVRTALKKLESTRQITCRSTHKSTCITICNFASYQDLQHDEQQSNQQIEQQTNNRQTTDKTASIPISSPSESKTMFRAQELKKETPSKEGGKKEGSQSSLLSLQKRAKIFYDSLIPFLSDYPKEMVRAFYDYWSEPNKSKTKMRFEIERTWETSRRLATWARRDNAVTARKPGKVEAALQALEDSGVNINDPLELL